MSRFTVKDHKREQQQFARRAMVALLCMLTGIGILVARYHYLQVTQFLKYHTNAEANRVHVRPVPPRRGLIYDVRGEILAENRPSYTLTIVKERVGDLPGTLSRLQGILGLDEDDLKRFHQQARRQRPFDPVPLLFQLTEEQIAAVAVHRHELPGVEVQAQLIRHYTQGPLLSHVIGYVGRINEKEEAALDPVNYAGTHYIGKSGVEKFYEERLHGRVGSENVEANARGRVLRVLEHNDPEPGADLTLHLDLRLQRIAAEALVGKRGAVVALDPWTGGILAAVSTPGFDPNLFVRGISSKDYNALRDDPDIPLFNRLIQAQYPPASTVKPIMGLAGLYYGLRTPTDAIPDPGWYRIPSDSRYYRDWKKWGHGYVDLRKAISQSCDTYFYDLAYKMGVDRINEFGTPFGLGVRTGVDISGERAGILPSREWKLSTLKVPWYRGETLSVGIGQGYMLATPVQLAVAAGTLATRGVRMRPHVVAKIGDKPVEPEVMGRVLDNNPAHWDAVWQGMIDVVHGDGTARATGKDMAYRMAGKTGTAQVVGIKQGEKYNAKALHERKRDHGLFLGFAPVEKPRIAVAVVVENGEHGSWMAPVARRVMDAYLLGPDKVAPAPAQPGATAPAAVPAGASQPQGGAGEQDE